MDCGQRINGFLIIARCQDALRLNFDRKLELEFHGTKVTSDAGLPAYREPDEALGLTKTAAFAISDSRTGSNTRHSIAALLRQWICNRLACSEDTNDAERLSVDPAMRHVTGGRATEHRAASTSQMGRFETEILTQPKNLEFLMNLPGRWVDQVRENRPQRQIILDMDSSVSSKTACGRLVTPKGRDFCAHWSDHSGKRENS